MSPEINRSAAAVLFALGITLTVAPASAQVKNWNAAGGNWNTPGNWLPFGVPLPGDLVFIGNTAPAQNAFLTLNVNAAIPGLTITDGMRLLTTNSQLVVTGAVSISGGNVENGTSWFSELSVDDGPNAFDAVLGSVTLSDEGRLTIDGGTAIINGVFTIEADALSLGGHGVVRLQSDQPIALLNDGGIGVATEGLAIFQDGDGVIDLDGSSAGDTLNVTIAKIDGSDYADLAIHGTALADAMDDDIWLIGGGSLTMDLDEGWTLGSNATLTLFGDNFEGPARIVGSHLDLLGHLEFISANAYGRFECPVTLYPSTFAALTPGDLLEFQQQTTVDGGFFTLDEDAHIDFNGPTTVRGGEFLTFSTSAFDGSVRFQGPTNWDGDVVIDGIGIQEGDADVIGPTHIIAGRFAMDGSSGSNWVIGNNLIIDAEGIDSTGNSFDGDLTIAGGFLGKLTINLDDPNGNWSASGNVTLGGVAAIPVTRIEGSEFHLFGDMDISNRVTITADTQLRDPSTVTFAGPGAHLRFAGESLISNGCAFSGGGLLVNVSSGHMTFEHGANLGATDLLNVGTLDLGTSPGAATVDQVTFDAASIWHVELGGFAAGAEHDRLQATGAQSTLAGALDVDLIDLGDGYFAPAVNDSFVILTAPPTTLSGAFANDPVSFIPGWVYHWEVGYDTTRVADVVTLTVEEIIPCPADLNGDGEVDGADLGLLLGSWGACEGCLADLSPNGDVDGGDLGLLLGAWGPCPL